MCRNGLLSDRPSLEPAFEVLAAVPSVDQARRRGRIVLPGDVPSPARPPARCRFHPRCPLAEAVCREFDPPAARVGDHVVHCHVAAISTPPADGSPHLPLPTG